VEWLESTGSEYFDTGIKYTQTTLNVEIDGYYTKAFSSATDLAFGWDYGG